MSLDLITLDEFKTYRGVTKGSDKEDSQITQLIATASDLIKTYCNRTFIDYYKTDKVEFFDGTKYNEVFLEEIPLLSVTEVATSTDGTTYTPLDTALYFVDTDEDSIYSKDGITFVSSSSFPKRSLKITFKGGYETPPADIKQAAMDIVEYYRSEQFTPRKMTNSMTLENIGFRAGSSIGLPPHIKRILEMYRVQTP